MTLLLQKTNEKRQEQEIYYNDAKSSEDALIFLWPDLSRSFCHSNKQFGN